VPVNGGGHTLFANQYAAYDSLPAATRARLDGLNLVHDSTRNTAGRVRPTKKLPTRREEVEGPVHPLVRLHPESGRRALYLGRRCPPPTSHVVELSDAESDALLDELWTNATRDEFVWGHDDWRPGDVLMWDNRCTLHTRTRVDNTRPRLLHRTLIRGEAVIAG
jgi:taurine dioxygenase